MKVVGDTGLVAYAIHLIPGRCISPIMETVIMEICFAVELNERFIACLYRRSWEKEHVANVDNNNCSPVRHLIYS